MRISFTVLGKNEPAGSKKAMPIYRKGANGARQLVTRANGSPMIAVVDDNSKSKGWKKLVAAAGREAMQEKVDGLLLGPLSVTFRFYRVRPKSHFKPNGWLSKKGLETPYPITLPDVLKLARGAEDALTGVVWRDDAQIVDERLVKCWGDHARLEVVIETMSEVRHEQAERQGALLPV